MATLLQSPSDLAGRLDLETLISDLSARLVMESSPSAPVIEFRNVDVIGVLGL